MFGKLKQTAIINQLVNLQEEKLISMQMYMYMIFEGPRVANENFLLKCKGEYERSLVAEVPMREEVIRKAGRHMNGAIRNHLELLELMDKEMLKVLNDALKNGVEDNSLTREEIKAKAQAYVADFMKSFNPRW